MVGIIEAVFHLTGLRSEGVHLLEKCADLLTGRDESLVMELEEQLEDAGLGDNDDLDGRLLRKCAETLRKAYERGVLLRDAERLLNGMMILPGPADMRTAAYISHQGLYVGVLRSVSYTHLTLPTN